MALGRKNALFAGSDGGGHHWAIVASLVATAKLNGVETLAWLTDVLEQSKRCGALAITHKWDLRWQHRA